MEFIKKTIIAIKSFLSPDKNASSKKIKYQRELVIVVFSLIFLIKMLVFNSTNSLWPLPEDLYPFIAYNLVIAWVLVVPELFAKKRRATYLFIVDIILTLILLGDSYYIRFFGTLPVISMLSGVSQAAPDLPKWLSKLASYSDLMLILDLIFIWVHRRRRKRQDFPVIPASTLSLSQRITLAILPLAIIGAFFAQDLGNRLPRLYNQTSENKVVAKNIGVINTHLLDFSRNFITAFSSLTPVDKEATIQAIKDNVIKPKTNKMTGTASDKRIIMIQVESLNNFTINKKVEGQEITPNLNKLMATSNYFADDYFTLGAGGTSDADFSANTSLFPLTDASVFVKYAKDDYTSLVKELAKQGYVSYAYHANNRGYWNRNTMFKSLGYNKFYAADNYKSGAEINMGLSDKDFLRQTAAFIKLSPKKSLNYVITLSSHFSFEIPKKEQTLTLNKSNYTELTGNYLQAIHYTDAALGEFIAQLKADGLYDDSIIVLYGDHTAKYDKFTSDEGIVDPNTVAGKNVPLIIKLPAQTTGKVNHSASSHLDVMPTILNLVGAKVTSPMFGRDLFGDSSPFIITNTYEDNFEQIISGDLKYLNDNTSLKCLRYTTKKQEEIDINTCNPLINKRSIIQNAVSVLIKRNLFNDYLKAK